MSDETFTNITDDVDAVLADPKLATAIAEHRAELADADRRYAMGLAAVRHAFDLTQTELADRLGGPTWRVPGQRRQSREADRPARLHAPVLPRRPGWRGTHRRILPGP